MADDSEVLAHSSLDTCRWCSVCLSKDRHVLAIASCEDCEEIYCEKHNELHIKRKTTSAHEVNPIEADSLDAVERPPIIPSVVCICLKKLKAFACNATVSIAGGERLEPTRAIIIAVWKSLEGRRKSCSQRCKLCSAGSSTCLPWESRKLSNPRRPMMILFITAIAIVDEHVRRMQAAVAASGTIIMQQLTTLCARKSKEQLGEQKLTLQFIQCDAHNIHNAVSKALACNDIPSLLVPYSGISPRSAAPQQNQPSWQLEPCSNGEVFFEPADLQAAHLGHIVDEDYYAAAAFKMEVRTDVRTEGHHQRTVTISAVNKTGYDMPIQLVDIQLKAPRVLSKH